MTGPLVVVQARAGSTRLPGKVLADLGGVPMLALQLERLKPVVGRIAATVVVANSDMPGDDAVAALARPVDVDTVRGSDPDVLDRLAFALASHPADTVVRLTGDCPFTDPSIVEAALRLHESAGADYTSNVLPRSFPKGLDVEVLSSRALVTAAEEAVDQPDREHVTPFVYRRPERFRLANLHSGEDLGREWWTVDTTDDLRRLRDMARMVPDLTTARWDRILAVVGRRAESEPGEVTLRPRPGPDPGSSPWVRRWVADVDGTEIGRIEVAAGQGSVDRRIDVAERWFESTRRALEALLDGDQQTRP